MAIERTGTKRQQAEMAYHGKDNSHTMVMVLPDDAKTATLGWVSRALLNSMGAIYIDYCISSTPLS